MASDPVLKKWIEQEELRMQAYCHNPACPVETVNTIFGDTHRPSAYWVNRPQFCPICGVRLGGQTAELCQRWDDRRARHVRQDHGRPDA
jgi:hypothetical protein